MVIFLRFKNSSKLLKLVFIYRYKTPADRSKSATACITKSGNAKNVRGEHLEVALKTFEMRKSLLIFILFRLTNSLIAWLLAAIISSPITILGVFDTINIEPEKGVCAINNRLFFTIGELIFLAFFKL